MDRPLTGRKVLLITVSAFAVIIGVNVTMAVLAVGTFPGLEVKNSYVASQVFESERAAQNGLNWSLEPAYGNGELTLTFRDAQGLPAAVESLSATVGRTTVAADDVQPEFTYSGGAFRAPVVLQPGKWMVLVQAFAPDGTKFHQRIDLFVKG
ncbi:MAG: FixH family protein [Rhodobacteraceae bacterium]|nr:FixH family protein [Paracoccaceae bacterium]